MVGVPKRRKKSLLSKSTPNLVEDEPKVQKTSIYVPAVEAATEDAPVVQCPIPHESRVLININLKSDAQFVYEQVFIKSQWFYDFLISRNCTEISTNDWEDDGNGGKKKVNRYINPLKNPIGAKTSNVTETMVSLPCSKPGNLWSYNVEVLNGGVPYQDSFYIDVHTCLVKLGLNECQLYADAQVKYKKSVFGFVKSLIEKSSYGGLTEFYEDLEKALIKKVAEHTGTSPEEAVKPLTNQQPSPSATISPAPSKSTAGDGLLSADLASKVVWGAVALLLLFNVVIYWKVSSLQSTSNEISPASSFKMPYMHFRNPPSTKDEWKEMVDKLHFLHRREIMSWKEVILSIVKLLKQTESAVDILQRQIVMYEAQNMFGDDEDYIVL